MSYVEIHHKISQACAHLCKVRKTHLERRFKNVEELLVEYESDKEDPITRKESWKKATILLIECAQGRAHESCLMHMPTK
jgi:hypothetical protein